MVIAALVVVEDDREIADAAVRHRMIGVAADGPVTRCENQAEIVPRHAVIIREGGADPRPQAHALRTVGRDLVVIPTIEPARLVVAQHRLQPPAAADVVRVRWRQVVVAVGHGGSRVAPVARSVRPLSELNTASSSPIQTTGVFESVGFGKTSNGAGANRTSTALRGGTAVCANAAVLVAIASSTVGSRCRYRVEVTERLWTSHVIAPGRIGEKSVTAAPRRAGTAPVKVLRQGVDSRRGHHEHVGALLPLTPATSSLESSPDACR